VATALPLETQTLYAELLEHLMGVRARRGQALRVDLLCPKRGAADDPVFIRRFGAAAQPLAYLDYLLAEPERALFIDGGAALVNVPAPARFAFHKLLVATLRPAAFQAKAEKVVRAPKSGAGPITVVAMGAVEAGGLVSDADSLYWAIPDGVNGILERVPKAGGVAPTPLAEDIYLGVLALDDQYVYWGASAPAKLVTDAVYPQEMVVDDQYLYWGEPGAGGPHDGRIRKFPR
jgi:nucleotidyltransferase-like protein